MNFEKKSLHGSVASHHPKASRISQLGHALASLPAKRKTMPTWQKKVLTILLAVATLFILWIVWSVYVFFSHFSLGEILMLFGHLERDEQNRTQILVLGSGDLNHDSPDLTDTMMIVSLNHTTHTVSLLSMPRDLWVDIPGVESGRINRIYRDALPKYGEEGAMKILKESMGEITGQTIQYYAKVDFTVFKEIVDQIGGVEIKMDYKLCDEQYPDAHLEGFDPFCIDKGTQKIDGEMALRLARSRHGVHLDKNNNILAYSSDFDRAARQQMLLYAIKDKVQKDGYLTSATTLKGFYDIYRAKVQTDLGFREIWSLAGFGVELKNSQIIKAVLNYGGETEKIMGDFLYPPDRNIYGGASILRPVGEKFDKIQEFVSLFFDYPGFFIEKPRIEILNGTERRGFAYEYVDILNPFGFNIVSIGNTEGRVERARTRIIFPADTTAFPVTQSIIRKFVPGVIAHRTAKDKVNGKVDVTIELGADLLPAAKK